MKAIEYKTTILACEDVAGVYERVEVVVYSDHPIPRNVLKQKVMKKCDGYVTFATMTVDSERTVSVCEKCGYSLEQAVLLRTQNIKVCLNCSHENDWVLDDGQAGIGYSVDEDLK